jgi:hypothetical protein
MTLLLCGKAAALFPKMHDKADRRALAKGLGEIDLLAELGDRSIGDGLRDLSRLSWVDPFGNQLAHKRGLLLLLRFKSLFMVIPCRTSVRGVPMPSRGPPGGIIHA